VVDRAVASELLADAAIHGAFIWHHPRRAICIAHDNVTQRVSSHISNPARASPAASLNHRQDGELWRSVSECLIASLTADVAFVDLHHFVLAG
jgi:hypothetical protein